MQEPSHQRTDPNRNQARNGLKPTRINLGVQRSSRKRQIRCNDHLRMFHPGGPRCTYERLSSAQVLAKFSQRSPQSPRRHHSSADEFLHGAVCAGLDDCRADGHASQNFAKGNMHDHAPCQKSAFLRNDCRTRTRPVRAGNGLDRKTQRKHAFTWLTNLPKILNKSLEQNLEKRLSAAPPRQRQWESTRSRPPSK
jgi:hypothetical protein